MNSYERRVKKLEEEGLTTSDAQGVVDAEIRMKSYKNKVSLKFYGNTDTVDIDAKSLGIHCMPGFDNRGLSIMIRHNGDKKLFELANEMSKIIVEALNKAYKE